MTLVERFGSLIAARSLHQQLLPVLLPMMADHRAALRKRTVTCIGVAFCILVLPLTIQADKAAEMALPDLAFKSMLAHKGVWY